jgi:hypothetical protein
MRSTEAEQTLSVTGICEAPRGKMMGPSCIAVIQKQELIERRLEIVEFSDAQLLVVASAAPQPKINPSHLLVICNINHVLFSLSYQEEENGTSLTTNNARRQVI